MTGRAPRLHATMRDTHCPLCGQVIYRNHSCHGRSPAQVSPEQRQANIAACYDAIRAGLERRESPEQGSLFDA